MKNNLKIINSIQIKRSIKKYKMKKYKKIMQHKIKKIQKIQRYI